MIDKISASAGVLIHMTKNDFGRICLARRSGNRNHSGFWEFPGGKIEMDESPIAALHREIWEELQVKIVAPKWVQSFSHKSGNSLIEVHFFVAHTDTAPTISTSHDLVRWFTIAELQLFFEDQTHEKLLAADNTMVKMLINGLFDITT